MEVGQPVYAGEPIAALGNTGSTYSASGKGDGSHLDYRIYNAYKKMFINPFSYFG